MAENGPSHSTTPSGNGSSNGHGADKGNEGARYEVGPGFEIAIRADADRPVQVTLKGDGAGAPRKNGDEDHGHEAVEKRLDAVERSLWRLAQQIQRIEGRIGGTTPHDRAPQSP